MDFVWKENDVVSSFGVKMWNGRIDSDFPWGQVTYTKSKNQYAATFSTPNQSKYFFEKKDAKNHVEKVIRGENE